MKRTPPFYRVRRAGAPPSPRQPHACSPRDAPAGPRTPRARRPAHGPGVALHESLRARGAWRGRRGARPAALQRGVAAGGAAPAGPGDRGAPGGREAAGRGGVRGQVPAGRPPVLPTRPQSSALHPPKTQEQPQAADALHHGAAAGAGAQVPPEAVPVHRRARRVLGQPEPHRDAGEDLVPEPPRQGQAAAGGRAGEAETGGQAAAARVRPALPPGRPPSRLPGRLRRRCGRPASGARTLRSARHRLRRVLPLLGDSGTCLARWWPGGLRGREASCAPQFSRQTPCIPLVLFCFAFQVLLLIQCYY